MRLGQSKLILAAENGKVTCDGESIIITPDIFGTWETVEDVVLSYDCEAEESSVVVGRNPTTRLWELVEAPPAEVSVTTGKVQFIIEPAE